MAVVALNPIECRAPVSWSEQSAYGQGLCVEESAVQRAKAASCFWDCQER